MLIGSFALLWLFAGFIVASIGVAVDMFDDSEVAMGVVLWPLVLALMILGGVAWAARWTGGRFARG